MSKEKTVPLVEQLESIPKDARLKFEHNEYDVSFYGVGRMSHEAAAELRRLEAENARLKAAMDKYSEDELLCANRELLKALKRLLTDEDYSQAERVAREAIQKHGGGA